MYLNWKKEKPHDEHYIDKIQVCRTSKDKDFLINVMNTETDLYVLGAIAVNELADEMMLLALLDLKREMMYERIALNKNASEAVLYNIACEILDNKIFLSLLNHDNCSARVIDKILIARNRIALDDSVYYALAENSNASKIVLNKLTEIALDEHSFKHWLKGNKNSSESFIYKTLEKNKSFKKWLKMNIIQNKNTSFEALLSIADKAIKEEDGYILEVLERRGVFARKKELADSSVNLLVS